MEYKILDCAGQDADYIVEHLVAYNNSKVPPTQEPGIIRFNKKIVDANGQIIAGCLAEMYGWRVMYVDILWVDENHRGERLGSRLLREMEQVAIEQNCTLIHLDTFDFQAKDFYLKHGYELFGTLEGCPQGHCRYYLKKDLFR